ncbi:MAG: phenylalanine--tRNA ligase subunit alpha [Bacteroidetes bacterium MED-G17]|nr:MAG: phenylalanine--tRNA ligase subunit alpha [Bacteroidetes bacterium MED-G17]|tara:strand:+ start:2936 stop:3943 length:1008 start_codon:yes stop_codon:yes gene_type:complete
MIDQLKNIEEELNQAEIKTSEELAIFYKYFLSKKGKISLLLYDFKSLPAENKRTVGKPLNLLKRKAEELYDAAKEMLEGQSQENSRNFLLDPQKIEIGARHPISVVKNRIEQIFRYMGFGISEGPEIEDDWHNFEALNFPPDHPARDMQDTFYLEKGYALRTHTSSVQVRVMETTKPPIKTISPGRVYRNEAVSARSNSFFHQVEGLHIDEGISFADLKQTLYSFVSSFFGRDLEVRFRASYFPFTEPSAEMDIFLGTETEEDKRLTKGTGWLEILGCGMVDEQVLKNCGIDPNKYSGYAFGMGIDRIAMSLFDIKDIRDLFNNDTRMLNQFVAE